MTESGWLCSAKLRVTYETPDDKNGQVSVSVDGELSDLVKAVSESRRARYVMDDSVYCPDEMESLKVPESWARSCGTL